MADILPFRKSQKSVRRKQKADGITLCRRGFHKWQIDQNKQFDVKQGKLVTIRRCIRCGETKTSAE